MPQPRIAPLRPPYEPEIAALLAKWMPPGGDVEPLALFRTLAVHDDLASRMRPLGAGILGHGRLDPRDREILIHRTCARAGAEYEFGICPVSRQVLQGSAPREVSRELEISRHQPLLFRVGPNWVFTLVESRVQPVPAVELSYCVVNTSQPELLVRGLDAIARERESLPFATEVLVLDNGSRDGSAQAAHEHPAVDETIALDQRRGKALNDSELLRRARGRYALLLNEDSELRPGATLALWRALQERPEAACAGARLLRPDGAEQASAWRFPTPLTALAGALFMHRLLNVQSRGERTREVDWCQSAALLVRREAAEQVDYLDPDFFVYSDEVDFARRLRDAGWRSVYVPQAVAVHHEQLSTDRFPSGGSSKWRATATCTCASTTPPPPPAPCAG